MRHHTTRSQLCSVLDAVEIKGVVSTPLSLSPGWLIMQRKASVEYLCAYDHY